MAKKKKRQNPEIDDLLARPWCYYCERDFDDLKILIHHQKAKHFKCDRCARRLNTAGGECPLGPRDLRRVSQANWRVCTGLRVHMEQVHKETLEQVENALPGRESIDLEIFGTEGIPETEVAAHNQRIMSEYAQKEADRRAASGQSNGPKRPKIDFAKELDPEEIRRKLDAHKKAMASGGVTPVAPAGGNMSPGRSQSPGGFDAHASTQVPQQLSYVRAPNPLFKSGAYCLCSPRLQVLRRSIRRVSMVCSPSLTDSRQHQLSLRRQPFPQYRLSHRRLLSPPHRFRPSRSTRTLPRPMLNLNTSSSHHSHTAVERRSSSIMHTRSHLPDMVHRALMSRLPITSSSSRLHTCSVTTRYHWPTRFRDSRQNPMFPVFRRDLRSHLLQAVSDEVVDHRRVSGALPCSRSSITLVQLGRRFP